MPTDMEWSYVVNNWSEGMSREATHRVQVHEPAQASAILDEWEPEQLLKLMIILILHITWS